MQNEYDVRILINRINQLEERVVELTRLVLYNLKEEELDALEEEES